MTPGAIEMREGSSWLCLLMRTLANNLPIVGCSPGWIYCTSSSPETRAGWSMEQLFDKRTGVALEEFSVVKFSFVWPTHTSYVICGDIQNLETFR